MDIPNVLKTAHNYVTLRLQRLVIPNRKFKANTKLFIQEVKYAVVIGERSALERMLIYIIDNPEMNREDIEAKLHESISEYSKMLTEGLSDINQKFTVDEILDVFGYYSKEK